MQPDIKWMEKRLNTLIIDPCDIKNTNPGVVNVFNPWAALKLFVLSATVNMYTKILHKSSFKNVYYIDAMAGSGVSKIKNRPEYLAGSPIIAATMAKHPFKKMCFIEKDKKKAKALEQRLSLLCENPEIDLGKNDFEILQGDSNKIIPELMEQIKKETNGFSSFNYLAFIDNEGLNIDWSTIDSLSQAWGDLLINFQSSNCQRVLGQVQKELVNNPTHGAINTLIDHIGSECCINAKNIDELKKIYLENLKRAGRPIQEYITVQGRRKEEYHYDLIYCTRETPSGSPYIKTIKHMKKKIESWTGDDIENVLKYIGDESHCLLDFIMPKEKQKTLEEY